MTRGLPDGGALALPPAKPMSKQLAERAALVIVDSFRSVMLSTKGQPDSAVALQHFVQQLGMHLTSWQATTFLVEEYVIA